MDRSVLLALSVAGGVACSWLIVSGTVGVFQDKKEKKEREYRDSLPNVSPVTTILHVKHPFAHVPSVCSGIKLTMAQSHPRLDSSKKTVQSAALTWRMHLKWQF